MLILFYRKKIKELELEIENLKKYIEKQENRGGFKIDDLVRIKDGKEKNTVGRIRRFNDDKSCNIFNSYNGSMTVNLDSLMKFII
jgi:transcription antitermination factor NusG